MDNTEIAEICGLTEDDIVAMELDPPATPAVSSTSYRNSLKDNSPKRKSVELVEHVFMKVEGLAEGIGQAKGQVKDKVKDVTPTIAKEGLKQVKEGTRQVKEGAKEGLAQVKEQVEGMTPTL